MVRWSETTGLERDLSCFGESDVNTQIYHPLQINWALWQCEKKIQKHTKNSPGQNHRQTNRRLSSLSADIILPRLTPGRKVCVFCTVVPESSLWICCSLWCLCMSMSMGDSRLWFELPVKGRCLFYPLLLLHGCVNASEWLYPITSLLAGVTVVTKSLCT